jgi:O-acetyl-ADP-ribose deacetylase (regulator of RNase III)
MVHERDIAGTRLTLMKGDITRQETDAIVNAANPSLMGGGGVDGAIHRAGGPEILEECTSIVASIGRCATGEAVITTGGNLAAKYVIHTVGPVWHGGNQHEPELLAGAYRNSLFIAAEKGIRSISFPSISTGAYGYPVPLAAETAMQAVVEFIKEHDLGEVRFVLFSDGDFAAYKDALERVEPAD